MNSYLFNSVSWKGDAREWPTFKSSEKLFFGSLVTKLGYNITAITSLANICLTIGYSFRYDAVSWISEMINHPKNDSVGIIEGINDLETFIRRFCYENRSALKRDKQLLTQVMTILDFLINHSMSSLAYKLRESIA